MAVPAAKIDDATIPPASTPEERLKVEAARLAELEAAYAEIRDKLAGIAAVDYVRSATAEERDRWAPGTAEKSAPFINMTAHQLVHESEAVETAEPKLRADLVAQRGLVSRLQQQVRGRQAAALQDEYAEVARRTAKALADLETCIRAERAVADRVHRTGVTYSPLPDLSFAMVGTRDEHNSPMAGWFRRARKAGVLA